MRCDTCRVDSPVVMRVVVAKDYNRILSRPIYNCQDCFEKKEQSKERSGLGVQGSGPLPTAQSPEPRAT